VDVKVALPAASNGRQRKMAQIMMKKGRMLVAAELGYLELLEELTAKQEAAAERRKLRRRAHQAKDHVCILGRPKWVVQGEAFEDVRTWLPILMGNVKEKMLAGGWPAAMFNDDRLSDCLDSVTQCPLCRDCHDDPGKVIKGSRRRGGLSGEPTEPAAPAPPAAAELLDSEDDDDPDYDLDADDEELAAADGEEDDSDDTEASWDSEDSEDSHLSRESGEEEVGGDASDYEGAAAP